MIHLQPLLEIVGLPRFTAIRPEYVEAAIDAVLEENIQLQAKFDENVLDPRTGQSFSTRILERGGSRPAMVLFRDLRGREPSIDALLRHCGLAA